MSVDTGNMCRLCFSKENRENDVVLSEIQKYLPFLDSFVGVSHDDCMPQKICSSCEFQIESSQLLRKRVKMTETLWVKFQSPRPEASLEVLLNCHLCNAAFDYHGLVLHIESSHEKNHTSECGFCSVLLGDLSSETVQGGPSEPAVNVVTNIEEQWINEETICDITDDEFEPSEVVGKRRHSERRKYPTGKRCKEETPSYSEDDNTNTVLITTESDTEMPSTSTKPVAGNGSKSSDYLKNRLTLLKGNTVTSFCDSKKDGSKEKIVCSECDFQTIRLDYIRSHLARVHWHEIKARLHIPEGTESAYEKEGETESHRRRKRVFAVLSTLPEEDALLNAKMTPLEKEKLIETVEIAGVRFGVCRVCNFTSENWNNVPTHVHAKHRKERLMLLKHGHVDLPEIDATADLEGTFQCSQCPAAFPRERILAVHVKRQHTEKSEYKYNPRSRRELTYTCAECQETLASAKEYNLHMLEVHGMDKRLSCEDCDLKFDTVNSKFAHRYKMHPAQMGGKLCGVCGECMPKHKLRSHMDRHMGVRPFKCDFEGCTKDFLTSYQLNVHKICHSQERPFACDFPGCEMAFKFLKQQVTHRRTHTGERNFKCSFESCSKAFNISSDLLLHERRHTGEKPFSCNGCAESFYTNSLLKKHRQGCARHGSTDE